MKLYRPVLIESAEQAEALPVGTFANVSWDQPRVKIGPDEWADSVESFDDAEMAGGEALVPIEAEEEREEALSISVLHGGTHTYPARTRLVTPWEST